MKTKLRWRYTAEAIPNQDGVYLCILPSSCPGFRYEVLKWTCGKGCFEFDGENLYRVFKPEDIAAWAALPWPEDLMEDNRDER